MRICNLPEIYKFRICSRKQTQYLKDHQALRTQPSLLKKEDSKLVVLFSNKNLKDRLSK